MIGLIYFNNEVNIQILTYTLLPFIGWVILWAINKLEHIVFDKYFEWTLENKPSKVSFFISLKLMIINFFKGNYKQGLKDFKNVSSSGFLKLTIAYVLGLLVIKGVILFDENMLKSDTI